MPSPTLERSASIAAAAITVAHVSKWFKTSGREPLHALQDIDLAVPAHSILAILGASGCGKSMLLSIISGLVTPERVAEILQKSANLKPDDAAAYAKQWNAIYITTMEPADVAMMKKMADIFKGAGSLKKDVPDAPFATEPYVRAKPRFAK